VFFQNSFEGIHALRTAGGSLFFAVRAKKRLPPAVRSAWIPSNEF
jgi:hypothetical protein